MPRIGCPYCMVEEYGGIPTDFSPNFDTRLCEPHAAEHPPYWYEQRQQWIVVVSTPSMAIHCTVNNPVTGRPKDPPVEVT